MGVNFRISDIPDRALVSTGRCTGPVVTNRRGVRGGGYRSMGYGDTVRILVGPGGMGPGADPALFPPLCLHCASTVSPTVATLGPL